MMAATNAGGAGGASSMSSTTAVMMATAGPGLRDAEVVVWMGDFNYRSVFGSGWERLGAV